MIYDEYLVHVQDMDTMIHFYMGPVSDEKEAYHMANNLIKKLCIARPRVGMIPALFLLNEKDISGLWND